MQLFIENVKKYYGDYLALQISSLKLEDVITWLQGENGSGKSTFLKMIAGIVPFTGNIVLNELYTIKKNRVKFLNLINYAQSEPLYPSFLTAEDLIKLYCHTKHGNINDSKKQLQQLHISDAYKKPLGTYSSGMIKKLSLVLAFIGKPQLVLLDEPLVTLDVDAVNIICSFIKNKYEQQAVSFIITSHQTIPTNKLIFTESYLAEQQTITKVNK